MKTNEAVLNELKPVFAKVFDDEDIAITMETAADDVSEWDSLSHIQLIVAIEKHFSIRFTAGDIYGFQNVGSIVRTIQAKTENR